MNRISNYSRFLYSKPQKMYPQKKRKIFIILSLSAFSSFAFGDSSGYTRHYQSYYENETNSRVQPTVNSDVTSTKHQQPAVQQKSLNNTLPGAEQHNSQPTTAKTQATERAEKKTNEADNQVSVVRLRQNELPVHWDGIGNNMEAGGLHGNIASQIEIEDNRRSDNSKNSGKFKLATIQAFLKHDELPGWYFGFYNAREDNYKGMYTNQDYSGSNTINEIFVGHIFETWRGNFGTELMGGSESGNKRWKYRLKLWQDIRLSSKWSLGGYLFGEEQPQNSQPGNNDLSQHIFETEPVLQYLVNPDMGVFLRPFYVYKRQERGNWGDIVEQEWKASIGVWRNWYPLLSSVYVGIGQKKTTNASDSDVLFYDGRYKYIGGTLSYPVIGDLRLYGEFKARFGKEDGEWTEKGSFWSPFTIIGVVYNF
ncbi:OmpG porin family protein [uncultured Cedecea sp.]|uniref:OmpG porin family protein n=1 Tax=uncultured Cedecea sp. TaxID=988762 RepID=UPI002604F024|nr:OmpG porin family protein [uncultured Cedecea sp.]